MYTAVHPTPRHRDRVYSELKSRLLNGDFAWDGRLGENALAKELEVSRTPIREALLRLWSEGLVERHPDGGFRPVMPDAAVIQDLYDVRWALELHALTSPARSGIEHNREVLLRVREEWSALADDDHGADPEFVLLDESFHLGIAEAAGNLALVDTLHTVNERIRIVRTQDFLTVERVTTTITEHLGIVDALLASDADLAIERWTAHLAQSIAVVEERSAQACLRMMRTGRTS